MKEILVKEISKVVLPKFPKIGEIIEGKIINEGRSSVYIDLGPIGTGIIYGREYQEAKQEIKSIKKETLIFVKIVDLENEDGYIELSLNQAGEELAWDVLKEKKDSGESFPVKIISVNKGGLLAQVSNINAFLPVSQLSPENYPRVEGGESTKILKELQKFVGQEIMVTILDISPREGKLILSEKAKGIEKVKENLKSYTLGDIVEGEITGVVDFGAFIRFGENLEGLIHISELDWSLVKDPGEFVKIGEKVQVKIIEITDDRVSLSLKALKKDPWQEIEKEHAKGDIVTGKVTKINPFGAFVQITPKIQGLCHISEFGTAAKMEEQLKVEKTYEFEIISLDIKEHRMSLKPKAK
ncbi:MAG: S1 RNA-binding domain-containing protein [bacterium]